MRAVLALLIIVGISRIHQHFGIIAAFHPGQLLFLAVVALVVLNPSSVDWSLLGKSWVPKAVLALGLLACFSAVFGLSLGQSGKFILEVYSRVLIPAIVFMVGVRRTHELRILVWAYLIGIGILMWITIFVMGLTPTSGGLARVAADYMYDGNDMGVLLMLALPMALVTMETSKRPLGKWLSILLLWGIGVTAALTGSRGAMVGLVSVGLALFFTVRHVSQAKKLVVFVLVAVALSVSAPPGYWEQMETIVNPEDDYNLTDPYGRKALALRGMGYMLRYPVFGVGIDNFGRAETEISPLLDEYARGTIAIRNLVAHNTYVQVGSELGVGGVGLWLALLGAGTFGVWKIRRRIPSWWRSADGDRKFLYAMATYLPVSFIGFASTSMFVSHAYLPAFYIFLGYVAALYHLVPKLLSQDTREAAMKVGHAPPPARGGFRPGTR